MLNKYLKYFLIPFATLLFVTPLLLTTCVKKIDKYELSNLNNNNITILGHKGMGELYKHPGNTFEGITPVFGIGADGTELDVQMTKDSVLVLFHNSELNQTTTCEGAVFEQNWVDIGACEYHCLVQNVYVITIDNLFSRTKDLKNLQFSFDCKMSYITENREEYMETFLRAVQNICDKYSMTNNIYLEGNEEFLTKAKEMGIKNKLFVTGFSDINVGIDIATRIGAFGLGVNNLSTTAEDVDNAHDAGLWVMMWGAKTRQENIKVIEKNADIVQTDKPIHMLKVFRRFNSDYRIP